MQRGLPPYLPVLAASGPKPKRKKKFEAEGAAPILLILFVVILVLGKMGIVDISWIPGVGGIFAPPSVRVRIFSEPVGGVTAPSTQKIMNLLLSGDARERNIVVEGPVYFKEAYGGAFNGVDILILSDAVNLTVSVRDQLANYMANGGKLVLVGTSGSKDPSDPWVVGWRGGDLGQFIPVDCADVYQNNCVTIQNFPQPTLHIIQYEHPITKQYSSFRPIDLGDIRLNVTQVVPNEGTVLAQVSSTESGEHYPAIVLKEGVMGGAQVIYFAYAPPSETRTLFLNAITYLARGG